MPLRQLLDVEIGLQLFDAMFPVERLGAFQLTVDRINRQRLRIQIGEKHHHMRRVGNFRSMFFVIGQRGFVTVMAVRNIHFLVLEASR